MSVIVARIVSLVAAIAVMGFIVAGFVAPDNPAVVDCMGSGGSRRGRFAARYLCSPHLLTDGARGWFQFVWLWSFPATFAAFSFFAWRRKRHAITF